METWRRLALYLLLLGSAGMVVELFLLGHYEEPWQWAPISLLVAGLALGTALAIHVSPLLVRSLRALMTVFVVAAGVGIYLHLRSNVEFELELRPSIEGRELILETLSGAIPALAPGAMAQLGLLGLLVCFRHPALGAVATEPDDHPKET